MTMSMAKSMVPLKTLFWIIMGISIVRFTKVCGMKPRILVETNRNLILIILSMVSV